MTPPRALRTRFIRHLIEFWGASLQIFLVTRFATCQ